MVVEITATYNEADWLPSLFRSLSDFVSIEINKWVKDGNNQNAGLEVYEISFDFPAAFDDPALVPLRNADGRPVTLIHFVVDDIDNMPVGIGSNEIKETVDEDTYIVTTQEAEAHVVNFDVGIWATDASGGSSSRLVAYQMLSRLFGPPSAREHFQSVTGGVEIMSFRGGRMIQETVNDIRVYRVIDCTLVARVYSANDVVPVTLVGEIDQDSGLIIGDTIIVDQ